MTRKQVEMTRLAAEDAIGNRHNAVSLNRAELLLIAIWFGLFFGWGETFGLAFRQYILGKPLDQSNHVFWLAPTLNTVLFLILAFVISIAFRIWRRPITLRMVTVVFVSLGSFALRAADERVHKSAWAVLSLGVAVAVSRLVVSRSGGFQRLVKRSVMWPVTATVLLAIVCCGTPAYLEHRALATLPAPASDAPNVLLLVLDTVPAGHMSAYGYPRATTPNLTRFAESALLFRQAISPSPWTLPSHSSMFTGKLPHLLSADWRAPLNDTHPTLAEVLARNGYATAGFVANNFYCQSFFGLHRGFSRYEEPHTWIGDLSGGCYWLRLLRSSTYKGVVSGRLLDRKNAATLNQSLLQWIDRRQDGRPFFTFVNYMDTHNPYLPPASHARAHGAQPLSDVFFDNDWNPNFKYSPAEIEMMGNAFDACLTYLDEQLGNLFEELDRRGLRENTVIIVAADHGEQFGEHGLVDHGNSLYLPLLHVPLMIADTQRWPNGGVCSNPVSTSALPGTVLEICGVDGQSQTLGESLLLGLDNFEKQKAHDSALYSEVNLHHSQGRMKSLLVDGLHYIRNRDKSEELYDLNEDPQELRNLIGTDTGDRNLSDFRERLKRLGEQSTRAK